MAEITLTVRQIMNLGLWDRVCEYKDMNPWSLNEGLIDENRSITFDDEFKKVEEEVDDTDYGDFRIICPRCGSEDIYTMTQSHECNTCKYER